MIKSLNERRMEWYRRKFDLSSRYNSDEKFEYYFDDIPELCEELADAVIKLYRESEKLDDREECFVFKTELEWLNERIETIQNLLNKRLNNLIKEYQVEELKKQIEKLKKEREKL